MKIDLANLDHRATHHLMGGAVVPRPIAWVSTVGEDGVLNLAPFAAYGHVSIKPALVGFCVVTTRDGKKKDTLRNIEFAKEFVINIVDETLAEAMNVTSTLYPSDVDEFKEAGVTPVQADLVNAPMVAESPIKMECRLVQILVFAGEGPITNSFVIGEVLRVHVEDGLYDDGDVKMDKLKAVGRLGGGVDLCCRTRDSFELKRPEPAG